MEKTEGDIARKTKNSSPLGTTALAFRLPKEALFLEPKSLICFFLLFFFLNLSLYSSLYHSVSSASLSFLICEMQIIISKSQYFSEDLMNVEALFKMCYENISHYYSSYGRINLQNFIPRFFFSYVSFSILLGILQVPSL